MPDSIRIDTGLKKILINDGPEFIEFNPNDVNFAERFYSLINDFEMKLEEYKARSKIIEENKILDANGIPSNLNDLIALTRDACEFIRGKIDHIFGSGTSQKVFGNALNLDMFAQFFSGLTPFIQATRAEKLKKYMKEVNEANSSISKKRKKRTAMK